MTNEVCCNCVSVPLTRSSPSSGLSTCQSCSTICGKNTGPSAKAQALHVGMSHSEPDLNPAEHPSTSFACRLTHPCPADASDKALGSRVQSRTILRLRSISHAKWSDRTPWRSQQSAAGTPPEHTVSPAGPPAPTRFDITVLQRCGMTGGRAQEAKCWYHTGIRLGRGF